MRMALAEFTVEGVKTNSDFLYLLMFDPEYLKGNFTTDFIDANLNKLLGWERDAKAIDEEDNG
jgi:acetyl-CoA carboxylase biotin carboxylase subunit